MIELDPTTLSYILTVLIVAITLFSGLQWRFAKSKITQLRELADATDDAIYDDKISEQEFRLIFSRLRTLIKQ